MNLLRYYKKDDEFPEVISVDDVENLIKDKNKEALANFIHDRFYYRYIRPFECTSDNYARDYKNGFSIMANCCLLIEALETFKQGWEDSNGKSSEAFKLFLTTDKNFTKFSESDMPTIFYKYVRCGILHQAETTGGWKITRESKDTLDISNKTINATKFMSQLKKSINDYKENLIKANWEDAIWKNAIIKIESILKSSKS